MKIKLYCLFIATLLVMPAVVLAQPQQANYYKQAAAAYQQATNQGGPNASCYQAWADYENCLANQLVSGVSVQCTASTCQPSSSQSGGTSTYSVM
jgi:hypothetical protein